MSCILVQIHVNLDKPRNKLTSYWKFNTLSLDEKDFKDQFLLTLKQELTEIVVGNKWCDHL